MAIEEEELEEKALDKKAVKKAGKDRKKEEKKLKKKAEEAEPEMEEESGGSKAVIAIVTLIIIVIWLAILALLIKLDVGGFGSSVLYPILKDVPYINKILPDVKLPENEKKSPYATMEDALKQIKVLEQEVSKLQKGNNSDTEYVKELKKEVKRLKVFEQEQAEFEKTKKEYYDEVVFSDKSPDIGEYKKFYESIDPANAESLYKQVVEQEQNDKKVTDYAKTYASMKPKEAAAIMEQMTDNLKLVSEILLNMDTESRAAILGAMKASVAASVTKLMEP
ncbi:MAG: hypothetical protein RR364_02950 [Lachnospiraceae bacterium]